MNTLRLIAIALPVMLLMACGGGGSGGGTVAAPTTPPTMMMPDMPDPVMLEDLPTALIANPATARGHINGSTAPSSTLTSTQIQSNFRSRATNNGDNVTTSDAHVVTPTTPSGSDMSGSSINLAGTTFTASLNNIATDIGDRFELVGVRSEYSSVMGHQGVTLAQHQAAGRNDDSDIFEYVSYGGWLTNSAFSVDMLTINDGSNESSLLIGVSYGDATGSRPSGTGVAQWFGSVVGVHKSNRSVIQGVLEITIGDIATSTSIDLIDFKSLRNINSGSTVTSAVSSQWIGVPIATDGTFSSTTPSDINGAFYGTNYNEVGGTFNWNNFIGAFGGTRH